MDALFRMKSKSRPEILPKTDRTTVPAFGHLSETETVLDLHSLNATARSANQF